MSKHIKKAFQADPIAWIVGGIILFAVLFMLNTCVSLSQTAAVEPIDAVSVTE
jgi:hypothetical protein